MMDKKNEQEFTRLVMKNKSTIYMVCYMFSQDEEEVKDLFQDILVKLWKGYDKFRGDSDIKTWIYRVSLNTCLDYQTRHKRKGVEEKLGPGIDPAEDVDAKSLQVKQLYSRIHSLGLIDRGIILLWLEGLSYDEIAAIVGISVQNVSVRLVRIKNQLKSMSDK
jgi:RNA polymerase sigma factor (sigma-70 family)